MPEDNEVFGRLKSTGRITPSLRHVITRQWNLCSVCSVPGIPDRPLFAGYGLESRPMLAHARCTGDMTELASPIYWTDEADISVPDSQTVWRYMDFAKFTSMLQQRGLYLPRASELDDRFEGAAGLATREAQWDAFYLQFYKGAVMSPPPGGLPVIMSEAALDQEAKRLLNSMKASSQPVRSSLVSCWHANTVESEALWRLYCPPPLSGVAIRSTVGKLWNATVALPDAVVGKVKYVDFRESFAHNGSKRLFFKRNSLVHENEVRIVVNGLSLPENSSRIIECDLNALVDEVVISPFAPVWFSEVVHTLALNMGLTSPIRESELLQEPFY